MEVITRKRGFSMSDKKQRCPVCMTKMQPRGRDLVCPECGYKYCESHKPYVYDDHNHSQYQTYTRQTTSTGNAPRQNTPQGTYGQAPQNRNTTQGTYGQVPQNRNAVQPQQNTTQSTYTRTQPSATPSRQGSSSTREPKSPARVVVTVIISIFILNFLLSILFSILSMVGAFL